MSYADGEVLIETKIQALTNFNAQNTSRGNFVIVNSGKSKHYCILTPGPFEREEYGFGGSYRATWVTNAQVWVKLKGYEETIIALQQRRQEIINQFDAFRKAGDTTNTIQDVFVVSGAEPVEIQVAKGAVFLMQELVIRWMEESSATLQE
jgi:hypothetical protein